jgi:KDO2-lipid IV(A) lauroyltransferase
LDSNTTLKPYQPAAWGPRLGFALLRLVSLLPAGPLMAVGRFVGRLFQRLARRRERIARINLGLCFPEMPEAERERLLRRHFEAVGMGLMTFAIAWWWPDRRLDPRVRIEGREHLQAAFDHGRGVIFFTGHFTSLEMSGRLLSRLAPALPMYRPNENPVIDRIIVSNRERHVERTIPRDDVRLMIRTLRANKGVWFAPDQNYGLKNSVFADFFGISAATNTSTSRFAELTGARVVPFVVLARPGGGFDMQIQAPLDDFPSKDPQRDTERLNDIIEAWAREAPEQYNWLHRRFKDRPGDEKRFY